MFTLKDIQYKDIVNITDLHIASRKITCIVGHSGSGKSTLLKLLNHLLSCDDGSILYNKSSLRSIDPILLRREVTMVPQVPVIFKGSVKDNLLIGLKFSEKPSVEDEKLIDTLKLVHLKKQLNEDAQHLSGGEKQRLALARALLIKPECYLLDEPTSALDTKTEELVMESFVLEVQKNQKSAIIVTHSMEIAEKFADTIIRLKNGQIVDIKER